MTAIYKLNGTLQQYAWGGENYIADLLQLNKQPSQQYAELWLGAHSSSPSQLEVDGKYISLIDFLAKNPFTLGQSNRATFGDKLPYLLKILDVKLPLSIQLHPTKQQAELGFIAENQRGIDLKDPKRIYKDNNHKPEMMIALSDFWLLHGFKPKTEIIATLRQHSHLEQLASKLTKQDLHGFYADIMRANQIQLSTWLTPILAADNMAKLSLNNPDYWIQYSKQALAISDDKLDPGLMCFYLFNIVHLQKGEGIFQQASIPHAYLRGQNIELMSCSDNVVRGGLTPKHVDIAELLKIVNCQEIVPQLIKAAPQKNGSFTYPTPAEDFALENINYQTGFRLNNKADSASILLVMEGSLEIHTVQNPMALEKGQAAFICAETEYQIEGLNKGYAVLAKLP